MTPAEIEYEHQLERINASIEKMRSDYGELITWHCEGGHIALDVPSALVTSIHRVDGAKRDIELRLLTGLLTPQIERIPFLIMKSVLGNNYRGNSGDNQRLVELMCAELWFR